MANLVFNPTGGQWVNNEKPGGAVFFVGGGTVASKGIGASNTNNGLTPEKPLSTIDKGITKCVSGRGDTVVVLPGEVTITSAVAIAKDDVTLTGFTVTGPKSRNPTILTLATGADLEMVSIDAANVIFENMTIKNTASAGDSFWIDVGDTTASPGTILRNLFIDCEGGESTGNQIRIGDGTTVSDYCLIDGCVLYDYDDVGITISDASEGCMIRNCDIYDNVSANNGLTGISIAADHTIVEDCYVKISAASASAFCINLTATAQDVEIRDTHCIAFGAGAHGIHYVASATGCCTNVYVTANALADAVDFATAVTGLSGVIGWASAPADGTISELINPNVA